MRRYLASGLVLLAAAAASADPTVAVLGIEPVDIPEQLSQALTDGLRQRAAGTPGIRVVQGKDLVEMKMIFGCDGEQTSCMAQAGRSLGAEKLLYGTLKKAGGKNSANVVAALKLLDVSTGVIEKFVNETVSKHDLTPGNVQPLASKWFSALVEVEARSTLTVTTEPAGASLTVDGQAAGRTPVTLRELSAGTHRFTLALAGRVPISRTIDLKPGGQHEISLQMEAEPVAQQAKEPPKPPTPQPAPEPIVAQQQPPPPPAGHPGRAAKGVAIGAFAAAVVAGAVAIYTWRTYRDLEDTAHNDLTALSKNASPTNKDFFDHPTCDPPASLGGAQAYKDHCGSGQTYADATTALWVTAGVLATAGVVSIIVGDRQAAKAKRETKTAGRLLQQSLRIAPVLSTKSGGLSASFEF